VTDFGCRWKQWILVAATSEGACLQIRHTVKVVLAFTEVGGFSRRSRQGFEGGETRMPLG